MKTTDVTIPEVIAQLDVMDKELDVFRSRLRMLRSDLFQTLDEIDASLVD